MTEDFGKEMLMLGGTLAGFFAAMLTMLEKWIDLRHRMKPGKERKPSAPAERYVPDTTSNIDFFSSKPLKGTSYL
ncbi:MAG TPA: hypothetical protein VH681_14910, partial [Nitrospiraceae bacterium]